MLRRSDMPRAVPRGVTTRAATHLAAAAAASCGRARVKLNSSTRSGRDDVGSHACFLGELMLWYMSHMMYYPA